MRSRAIAACLSALASVALSACAQSIRVHGTYPRTYARCRDAVLGAGFDIEDGAKGTYGEQPDKGRIDFFFNEPKGKFEGRRFVTLSIDPHADVEDRLRTISVNGWSYSWLSVVTASAYREHEGDIQRKATVALQAEFGEAERPDSERAR